MNWFTTLFGEKNALNAWQECARAIVIFLYGLALVRIAGRRIFGKWAALDIVVSIIIGSNLSRIVTGNADFLGTLVSTTLLVALHWVFAYMAARVPAASRLFEGEPVVVAKSGSIVHAARVRHSISEADISEALRQTGVETPARAERITLEPSGKLTVLKRES